MAGLLQAMNRLVGNKGCIFSTLPTPRGTGSLSTDTRAEVRSAERDSDPHRAPGQTDRNSIRQRILAGVLCASVYSRLIVRGDNAEFEQHSWQASRTRQCTSSKEREVVVAQL